jgi:hypothetical protein
MKHHGVLVGIVLLSTTACTGMAIPPSASGSDGYRYELTARSAYQCGAVQAALGTAMSQSDPEWSRRHTAMSMAWFELSDTLGGGSMPKGHTAWQRDIAGQLAKGASSKDQALKLAEPCEVMSTLYRADYADAVAKATPRAPATFADDAAFKRQVGGDYPEASPRELTFDNWLYFARGNLCLAQRKFDDGAEFMFRFTNFNDGSIQLKWSGLPALDAESDDYETQFGAHRQGLEFNEDVKPKLADGLTYATFPGSGIFVDNKIVAVLTDGQTTGTDYYFGANVQGSYYNNLPVSRELSIKVLGKETHRFRIDNAAFWNEMSECVAQYPFG